VTAGQVHEATQARALIEGLTLVSLIADKAYDNDAFRAQLASAEIEAVIPPLGSRAVEIDYDQNAYGLRHRVECFINKIKHYRRVFTRFEKLSKSYLGFLSFVSALIWLR